MTSRATGRYSAGGTKTDSDFISIALLLGPAAAQSKDSEPLKLRSQEYWPAAAELKLIFESDP